MHFTRLSVKRFGLVCFLVVMLALITWAGLAIAKTNSAGQPYGSYQSSDIFFPPYHSDSNRMGYDKASANDTTALNAGWYLDWGTAPNPSHPGGAEYARLIFLKTDTSFCNAATQAAQITPSLTGTALINAVQAHPGAVWIIGNEPDSLYNGDPIQPEVYAEFYHYFVTNIKATDPTARVSVAPIVQPSPLRMEYLDKILAHYQTTYGQQLPADLWNIHFYILNEGPCGTWGAAVPPFASQSNGWRINFNAGELLNLTTLENNLRAFRQWMADRGYQDMPLIITEYGVLPPPSYSGFSDDVAAQFLIDSFKLFLNARDSTIGYPADDHRLVQMWAWFSTSFGPYGGDLFTDTTGDTLTVIGQAFANQTQAHYTPYIDLQLSPPIGEDSGSQEPVAIERYLSNRGNTTATPAQARVTLQNYVDQTVVEQIDYDLGSLNRRYAHSPVSISKAWGFQPPYAYTVTVEADPDFQVVDVQRGNNLASREFIIYPDFAVTALEAGFDLMQGSTLLLAGHITTTLVNSGNWTSTETTLQISVLPQGTASHVTTQTITVPALAPDEQFIISTHWPFPAESQYQIIAELNPNQVPILDLIADNNTQSISFSTVRVPRLTIQKLAYPTLVQPTDLVTYTVVVSNMGTAPALNVTLADTLPDGVSFVGPLSITKPPAGGTGSLVITGSTQSIALNFDTIEIGEVITLTIPVAVKGDVPLGTRITNTAALLDDDSTMLVSDSVAVAVGEIHKTYLPLIMNRTSSTGAYKTYLPLIVK